MREAIQLLARGEAGTVELDSALMKVEDVDYLLVGGLRAPTFRVIKDGVEAPRSAICHGPMSWGSETVDGVVDIERVHEHVRTGWTLALDEAHRNWGPLARLVRQLESGLNGRGRADVLVVPPGGSPPIDGLCDRIVCVLEGDLAVRLATSEVRLSGGMAQVVPTGSAVTALPVAALTLVAVIRVERITWRDVLIQALDLADAPVWHELAPLSWRAPVQVRPDEREAWAETLQALDDLDVEDALEALIHATVQSRPPLLPGQLVQTAPAIDENTPLRRRPEVLYRILEQGQHTLLCMNGERLEFGLGARRVLELIAEAPLFRPSDLPGVPPEQRVPLCRALVRSGFLTTDIGG